MSLKVTIIKVKKMSSLCKFSPLADLNLSVPHCGLLLPSELCLSSCPALWFVQAPNPTRPALQWWLKACPRSHKVSSLEIKSSFLQTLLLSEAGATDFVLVSQKEHGLSQLAFTSHRSYLYLSWKLSITVP